MMPFDWDDYEPRPPWWKGALFAFGLLLALFIWVHVLPRW